MGSACVACGERYPSVYYFAGNGVCKTCAATGDTGTATGAATEEAHRQDMLLERRLWLGVGGNVVMLVTIVFAIAELFAAIAGTSIIVSRFGAEGVLMFFFGLVNVALILAFGFAITAAFFTLRALDDDLRRRTQSEVPSVRD